ncbi:hypothetical protein DUNSADRAFT_11708 [Dunaliella salina]|uniref:Cyclic nucleotide-binding domain-containing protein n=1 Tax=Dunaliella salina TaxID=3046 RepID=A0ABQ7GCR9_DUNSA|nr:hypothetical protein DUNSADRAFT_11708 [Dunaliella salina]|eukprot:KAF5832406.1 hypothetical protein DUNSADRAFT_11708 [Dunaliella salina]
MSSSNKILPLGLVAVEGPSSLRITTQGAPSGPIPTPFALPSWQPPEEKLPFSDRLSWEPPGVLDDRLSVTEPATTPSKGAREHLLPKLFPWLSSSHHDLPAEGGVEGQAGEPALKSSKYVVLPHSAFYIRWYILIVTVALLVAIFDPYNAAFVETGGMYPFYNFWAVTDYIATVLLTADVVLKFFLAYKDEKNKCMITDNRAIAWRYFTSQFFFDLVVSIPMEPIVAGSLGITVRDTKEAEFVGLLRWLRIGRMYPIFEVFATIQHKHILPPVVLTLARNYTYLFYIVHWFACVLFFIARVDNFSEDTWFGRDEAQDRVDSLAGWADYLYSFYLSIGVFTGFSNEVFFKQSPVEALVLCIYFVVNVVAQAYILGTITVLLVKNDVESGEYRNAVVNLDKYLSEKQLPKSLQTAMHEHLELQSYSEKRADENILKHYPSTIKQKVLRHMYMDVLKDCYLLAGCSPQFLNLLLSVVRMELFMPNVTMTQEGDTAGDLVIIADGNVNVAQPCAGTIDPQGSSASIDPQASGGGIGLGSPQVSKNRRRSSTLFPLDPAIAVQPASARRGSSVMFSTDPAVSPQPPSGKRRESTLNPSSILFQHFGGGGLINEGSVKGPDSNIIIGDSSTKGKDGSSHGGGSFASATSGQQSFLHGLRNKASLLGASDVLGEVPFFADGSYTSSARTSTVTRVLIVSQTDFQRLAECNPKDVSRMYRNLVKRAEKRLKEVAQQARDAAQLEPSLAHALLMIAEGESFDSVPSIQLSAMKRCLTPAQLIIMDNVSEARRLVREDTEKHQILRMNAYLNAAVNGDMQRLPALIGRGREVSATDYDKRSALMLACRENQEDAVEMLLKAGADTSTVDSFGYTAMFEAVRKGNDGCISRLLKYNAKLGVEPRIIAPYIFKAIFSKDLDCLRRFIRVGADLDCTDLDGRTPLFLAASEGLLEAVILLVGEGNASVDAVDFWGHTAEGDAHLAGHHEVAQYLHKQVKGGDKWPLLANTQGSVSAPGAEEPKSQATPEPPHLLPENLSPAVHSSVSSQPVQGSQSFGSRPGSSTDQKRQELLKSLRHKGSFRSGGSRRITGALEEEPHPTSPSGRAVSTTSESAAPIAFQEQPHTTSLPSALTGPTNQEQNAPIALEQQLLPISPQGLAGPTSPSAVAPITFEQLSPPTYPASLEGPTSSVPTAPTVVEKQRPPISPASFEGPTSSMPTTPITLHEQPPPTYPASLAGPANSVPAAHLAAEEQPPPTNPASFKCPTSSMPTTPITLQEQPPPTHPASLAGPANSVPAAHLAAEEQPPPTNPASFKCPTSSMPTTPITLQEQPPPTHPASLAGLPSSVPTTPITLQEQPPPTYHASLAGPASSAPTAHLAAEEQPPPTNPASFGGLPATVPTMPITLQEQLPPTNLASLAGPASFAPTARLTVEQQPPPISPPASAGPASSMPASPTVAEKQPPPISPPSAGPPKPRPSAPIVLGGEQAPSIFPPRTAGPTILRPSAPVILEEQAPYISPPGLAGLTSSRPQVPIAFAEQPPPISDASLAGVARSPTTCRPVSQLSADPTSRNADVQRPPGTSPAGWMAFDGGDRPGSRPTQTLPTEGSRSAGRSREQMLADSMVLPFVDPELQQQQQHPEMSDVSEDGVEGS